MNTSRTAIMILAVVRADGTSKDYFPVTKMKLFIED